MEDEKKKQVKNDDGFSSEQQLKQQIVQLKTESWEEPIQNNQEVPIRSKLQPATQIQKQSYSLQPDMINGWLPKIPLLQPIPLTFKNYQFDAFLDFYDEKKTSQTKITLCYLGARYESTFFAWYDKNFQFPYKHMKSPTYFQITDRYFCGQHWDAETKQFLIFDSLYESGNLDAVFKVGEYEYDLFMRVDSNTRGHLHWFNFKVKNFEKGKQYKINICNFRKNKTLYSRGMKPYVFSKAKYQNQNIGWHQFEGEAKFGKKICKSFKQFSYETDGDYYHLKFKYLTEYSLDQVQFAYCIPYTFTYLEESLELWRKMAQNANIFQTKKLCTSLGGLDVPEITITNNVSDEIEAFKKKQKLNKKIIFITGRCHPGESNGSWMVHGLIEFLLSQNKFSQFLRENIIFKIFPMINPDGVVIGNYRTGLSGKDFNRQFIHPDKLIFPQICNLKETVWKYKELYQDNAQMYFDFHGHSVKKNVFAYGPEFPIIHKCYYESRFFLKLLASKTDMFRYYSCIFKISESKSSTARAVIIRNFRIPLTYTIQASNGFYYDQETLENYTFDEQKWKKMGMKIVEGLFEYFSMIFKIEQIRQEKLTQRKKIIEKARSKKLSKKVMNLTSSTGFHQKKGKNDAFGSISLSQILSQNIPIQDKNMENLFNEIKLENDKQNEEKVSDDEISEGSSDSQGSKDDLDSQAMQNLIRTLKKKSSHNSLRGKMKKLKEKNIYRPKTTQTEEQIDQDNEDLQIEKKRKNFQINPVPLKKFLKKKCSLVSSLSPKKEQNSQQAKIVTFSFNVQPIEGSSRKKKQIEQEQIYSFSQTQEKFKRPATRSYEYSETFKKTFLSVQKQILRRDSCKRQMILLNFRNGGSKKTNSLVDNIQGKKLNFS